MNERRQPWRSSEVVRDVAREMRKAPTEAEKALWEILRFNRCDGFRFRRQFNIGTFIPDFYCAEVKLAVEADGGIHNDPAIQARDREREEMLLEVYGITVIRFTNDEILKNPQKVKCEIAGTARRLKGKEPPPCPPDIPPPLRRGETSGHIE